MTTKRAPAKRAAQSRPASTPAGINLRSKEQWVAIDGTNIRHIADTESELWVKFQAPICGARAVSVRDGFIPTEAKLPICENCLADH